MSKYNFRHHICLIRFDRQIKIQTHTHESMTNGNTQKHQNYELPNHREGIDLKSIGFSSQWISNIRKKTYFIQSGVFFRILSISSVLRFTCFVRWWSGAWASCLYKSSMLMTTNKSSSSLSLPSSSNSVGQFCDPDMVRVRVRKWWCVTFDNQSKSEIDHQMFTHIILNNDVTHLRCYRGGSLWYLRIFEYHSGLAIGQRWLFGVTHMKAVSVVLENSRVLSSTLTNSALVRVAQAAILLVNYSHRKIPRMLNHSRCNEVQW